MNIAKRVRQNIRHLKAYSSGKSEFSGEADIFIDTNENPFGNNTLNRYPDPRQKKLCHEIGRYKNISPNNIVLGNGSDELIDQIIRIFCEPKVDSIMFFPPTFGMYSVSAQINEINTVEIPLTQDFSLNFQEIQKKLKKAKIVFLCNPNNPTGNTFSEEEIEKIIQSSSGIVVIDEAYVDFCPEKSFLPRLDTFPNLIILQTFSKAWGLAGARLGVAYASKEIIDYFLRIKAPYNINVLTAQAAQKKLENFKETDEEIQTLSSEKKQLIYAFKKMPSIVTVFPSDANFLLVRLQDGNKAYNSLLENGIVVRNFSSNPHLKNCLRISIGTPAENKKLISVLQAL